MRRYQQSRPVPLGQDVVEVEAGGTLPAGPGNVDDPQLPVAGDQCVKEPSRDPEAVFLPCGIPRHRPPVIEDGPDGPQVPVLILGRPALIGR